MLLPLQSRCDGPIPEGSTRWNRYPPVPWKLSIPVEGNRGKYFYPLNVYCVYLCLRWKIDLNTSKPKILLTMKVYSI